MKIQQVTAWNMQKYLEEKKEVKKNKRKKHLTSNSNTLAIVDNDVYSTDTFSFNTLR